VEAPARARGIAKAKPADVSLMTMSTLVLWTSCLVVGLVGWLCPYPLPRSAVKHHEPLPAEILNVELTPDSLSLPNAAPVSPDSASPPALQDLAAIPSTPPLIAVAEPSPALAFALPLEGPTQVVEAKLASYARQTDPAATAAVTPTPAVQTITYGLGEGKQPAPEYPAKARRDGLEGNVGIRFSVDPTGRVSEAETSAPSPWRLLNDAALRAVRERWHFKPGTSRRYQVSIRFELTK
jgi:periplasmic protein TonB